MACYWEDRSSKTSDMGLDKRIYILFSLFFHEIFVYAGTHLKYLNKTLPVSTQTNSYVIEYWSRFGNFIGQFWMKKLYQASSVVRVNSN